MARRRSPSEQRFEAASAAYLRHGEGWTHQKIANELSCSVSTVRRLLKEAERHHLVTIEVRLNADRFESTEARLAHRLKDYGFRRDGVRIAPTFPSSDAKAFTRARLHSVCAVAARFIEESCQQNSTIVVDAGTTLRECARHLTPGRLSGITLCPFYVDPISDDSSSFEVMLTMALRFPERVRVLKPPSLVYRSEFLDRETERIRAAACRADLIILGVSSVHGSAPHAHLVLRYLGIDPEKFFRQNADVVAFCGNLPLRSDGSVKRIRILDRRIPQLIDVDTLKHLSHQSARIVVVAAGNEKKEAVSVAIRSGIPNCIVLDAELANLLLADF
ncbi:hypothetical protein GC176_25440 [bacterium]|nr:hypothetical protein [bacterium]